MAVPAMLLGESLVTMDKPMGERKSSPVVCKRYKNTKVRRGTIASSFANWSPNKVMRKPAPS